MTITDFLRHLPQLRAIFPHEIVMEWPLADYLAAMEKQRAPRAAERESARISDGHPDPAEFLKRDLWKESPPHSPAWSDKRAREARRNGKWHL